MHLHYEYDLNIDEAICTVRVTGTFKRPQDAVEMQQFACMLPEDKRYHTFLFDMRRADIISNTAGTFNTVELHAARLPALRKLKVAALYNELSRDEYFFENVANNRGFNLSVYDSFDNAHAWLVRREE
jgi:hypothetical protein